MAPPLTADATTMIEWCLKEPRPTHFFTGRLGLPHSDHNKKDKGRPSFEGSAAHSCKDLYQSTLMSVNLLTHRFLTKEALRVATVQNRDELIAQVTEPLLADYGSAIWCTSEPYTTRIGPEYPQYLKHDNNMDRERIMLYLYCWIIARVIRRLPKDPPNKPRQSVGRPSPRVIDLSSDSDESYNSDHNDNAESIIEGGTTAANPPGYSQSAGNSNATDHNAPQLMAAENSQVPVAQMIPKRGIAPSRIATNTGKLRTATNSLTPTTTTRGAVPNDDDDSSGSSDSEPPHVSAPSIKRRGFSSRSGEPLLNKRLKCAEKPAGSFPSTSRLRRKTFGGLDEVERFGPASYPSPPSAGSMDSGDVTNGCNFPNVRHDRQHHVQATRNDAPRIVDARSEIQAVEVDSNLNLPEREGRIVAEKEQSRNNVQWNVDDSDDDSVQGRDEGRRSATTSCKTTPSSTGRPRLVVPLKIVAQQEDLEFQRLHLSSKLVDVLPERLQQPNIVALSSTVELLDILWKADRLRLMDVYGEEFGGHQRAFEQWLQCLKHVLRFYELTGFKDNLDALDAFLGNVQERPPIAVRKVFIHARVSLMEWQKQSGIDDKEFAEKVASILFNLSSCGIKWAMLDDLESTTPAFTKELLAWFR